MNRRTSTIFILAAVIILAVVFAQPAFAGHQWILLHHEDQGRGQPTFEQCMPIEAWAGHADHIGDWYQGPYDNNECLASTPMPTETEEPTNEPQPTPTEDASATDEPGPTPTPTDEEGQPTPTPTATDIEPTPTATEATVEPTPTVPPTCVDPKPEPCGYLFHLVGPNGQEADFASFSPRPGGGWYLPNVGSQLRCLGWVAVSAPYGRELYGDDVLTSCDGGQCFQEGQ